MRDVQSLCIYIDEFYFALGHKSVEVNTAAIFGVISGMTQRFPSPFGAAPASPFKKVASFVVYFVAGGPILTPIPEVGEDLAGYQNAVLAYFLAVDALQGATINCERRGVLTLTNRITVSQHFWKDLIVAMSRTTPDTHFNFVSLIFESLVYQVNPEIPYPEKVT